MSEPITPNMNLLQPITGVTAGSTANDDYNANWTSIDQHDHTPGKGVQVTPAGFNVTQDLPFNGNNATTLRSARFSPQVSALSGISDLACVYFSGVDLWANDAAGNQIQITSGGGVNATSSGISSGTATASFVSSVLVVNAASNKPANIQGASLLLGNNVTSSHYLTLSPPSAMGADYTLILPSLPGATSILALDTSGNITAAYTVDNTTIDINGSSQLEVKAGGITTTQISSTAGILGSQLSASAGIVGTQLAAATLTGTEMSSSINLPGTSVEAGSLKVITSSTNASTGLKMIRAQISVSGLTPTLTTGEGCTIARTGAGAYTVSWSSAFASTPVVVSNIWNSGSNIVTVTSASTTQCTVVTSNLSGTSTDNVSFSLIAIGPR